MARLFFWREFSTPAISTHENSTPAGPGGMDNIRALVLLLGSLALVLLAVAACAEVEEQIYPQEAAPVSLILDTRQLITHEWGGSDSFTLLLSGAPPSNFALNVTSGDPMEGTVSPETIYYSADNWDTPQTVTVTGADDDLIDGNKHFTVEIELTGDGGPLRGTTWPLSVDVVNYDDDVAALLVQSIQTQFSEADGSGEFTVSLTRRPDDDVVVEVTCTDPYKALLSTGNGPVQEMVSLLFTTEDWHIPQWVFLTGQDNDYPDGDHVLTLAVAINTETTLDNSGYLDAETQGVEIIVEDDELAGATTYLSRECTAFEQM